MDPQPITTVNPDVVTQLSATAALGFNIVTNSQLVTTANPNVITQLSSTAALGPDTVMDSWSVAIASSDVPQPHLITPPNIRMSAVVAGPDSMVPIPMDFDVVPELIGTPTLNAHALPAPFTPTPSDPCKPTDGTPNDPCAHDSRPLPLPNTLESAIHSAVREQLDSTTTHLVDSTVCEVVDACVFHLEKFINAKVDSLLLHKQKHTADGWEGDNKEEDTLGVSPRKKPRPCGHMNHLHVSTASNSCLVTMNHSIRWHSGNI